LLRSGLDGSEATKTLWKTGIFQRLEPRSACELMRQAEPIDFESGHVVFAQDERGSLVISDSKSIAALQYGETDRWEH